MTLGPNSRCAPSNPCLGKRYVPPHDPLQHQLVQIWEEATGAQPIGIRDSLSELGADITLVSQILRKVEEVCGIRIPDSVKPGDLTVEELADALVAELPLKPIFQIQRGESRRPPFFFLHGDFSGGGFYARALSSALNVNVPFYAVQPHGINGQPIRESIHLMAEDNLKIVRRIQPNGPYYFGGHCNGALIAFEMARRLRSQNEETGLLVLIHAWFKGQSDNVPQSQSSSWPELPAEAVNSPRLRNAWMFRCYSRPLREYMPQAYDGKVNLFWPSEEPHVGTDPRLAWRRFAPDLKFRIIPGNHLTCITRHVKELATELKICLSAALK